MLGNRYVIFIIALTCLGLLSSCSTHKRFITTGKNDFLIQILDTNAVFKDGICGMMVSDLGNNKTLFAYHQDKRFIPASNIKLLTMAYALEALGDSIPSFRYISTDSTLTLWPCSDPTLLHPYYEDDRVIEKIRFLANGKKVMISYAHADITHFGRGWSWDDYQDYYQTEITAMPMYGNVFTVANDSNNIQSPYTQSFIKRYQENPKVRKITRAPYENTFYFPYSIPYCFRQEIPYFDAENININLLADTLNTEVLKVSTPPPPDAFTIYSWPIDTLLRRMMQVSDNMLAEHLLLAIGMKTLDTINTDASITHAKALLLNKYKTSGYRWVDASGLSRYNNLKPHIIISLLDSLYKTYPEQRLFSLLAVGGQPGSLSDMYNDEMKPYIFAKTGSMSGVYNLCGYLKTKSGRTLAISFMSNNMSSSTKELKIEVEKIVKWFRYNY